MALFFATFGLIIATGVLGHFAKRQARDTKTSIDIAAQSAKAAVDSVERLERAEKAYIWGGFGDAGSSVNSMGLGLTGRDTGRPRVDGMKQSQLTGCSQASSSASRPEATAWRHRSRAACSSRGFSTFSPWPSTALVIPA